MLVNPKVSDRYKKELEIINEWYKDQNIVKKTSME